MTFGSALVAIVAILAFTAMRIVRYNTGYSRDARRRDRQGEAAQAAIPSPREAELQREVEDLRERVKVLERITTDAHTSDALQSRSIAAEIESLRDR